MHVAVRGFSLQQQAAFGWINPVRSALFDADSFDRYDGLARKFRELNEGFLKIHRS